MIPSAEWNAAKWQQGAAERERLARWLRVPAAHEWASYALLPFAVVHTDDGPAPCAALVPPLIYFDTSRPVDEWPLDRMGRCHVDSDVVRCDTGVMHRVGGASVVMPTAAHDAEVIAYIDAPTWARAWAAKRMQFMEYRRMAMRELGTDPAEPPDGGMPGALIIGGADKIKRWPGGVTFKAPTPADAKIINISIWRNARLARAV